ncbi:MAG: YIP1 family protein [Candidatus Aenigmatarchaeota archaeon]
MNWLKEWAEQAKKIVLSPVDFYEDVEQRGNYSYPIKFAVTSGIVLSLLVFVSQEIQIMAGIGTKPMPGVSVLESLFYLLLVGVISGTLGLLLQSGFIHVFVKLFGFDGYQKTTEAVSYPTAINALFGWIPILNLLVFIYIIYAEARGIEKMHGMSTGKAAASVILGTVLLGLVVVLIVFIPLFWLGGIESSASAGGQTVPLEALSF